jgi:hypothetical protein
MTHDVYLLMESLSAIQLEEHSHHPVRVQLTIGTIVTITGQIPDSDLVNLQADGNAVIVFLSDLKECSEQLRTTR